MKRGSLPLFLWGFRGIKQPHMILMKSLFLYRQKGSAERNGLPLGEQVSKILGELISP